MSIALPVSTLAEMREHVRQTLCRHDQRDPLQTSVTETVITRSGRPCGMLFQAHGSRSRLAHAIWATEENRLLFYDCRGTRFYEVHITDPIPLTDVTNGQC